MASYSCNAPLVTGWWHPACHLLSESGAIEMRATYLLTTTPLTIPHCSLICLFGLVSLPPPISLGWFRSYLSSRSSSVSIGWTSSNITISWGPYRARSSDLFFQSLHHSPKHSNRKYLSFTPSLCRPPQLITSFVLKVCPIVINQLQSSVSTISSWMTANLLTLNPSIQDWVHAHGPTSVVMQNLLSLSFPTACSTNSFLRIRKQSRLCLWPLSLLQPTNPQAL